MTERTNTSTQTLANQPRPIGHAIQAGSLLVLLLIAAVAGLAVLKTYFDGYLLQELTDRRFAQAHEQINNNEISLAETSLVDLLESAPQLRDRIAWEFMDWLPVMPELRRDVAALLAQAPPRGSETEGKLLETEFTLRFGDPSILLSDNPTGSAEQLAFQRLAILESNLPVPSARKRIDNSDLRPLPEKSMLASFWSAPAASETAEAWRLWQIGQSVAAKARFEKVWNATKQPNTAYMLGLLAEEANDETSARQWYARAIESGANHPAAAIAYIRLSGP